MAIRYRTLEVNWLLSLDLSQYKDASQFEWLENKFEELYGRRVPYNALLFKAAALKREAGLSRIRFGSKRDAFLISYLGTTLTRDALEKITGQLNIEFKTRFSPEQVAKRLNKLTLRAGGPDKLCSKTPPVLDFPNITFNPPPIPFKPISEASRKAFTQDSADQIQPLKANGFQKNTWEVSVNGVVVWTGENKPKIKLASTQELSVE